MRCVPGCVCEVSEGPRSIHPLVQGGANDDHSSRSRPCLRARYAHTTACVGP